MIGSQSFSSLKYPYFHGDISDCLGHIMLR